MDALSEMVIDIIMVVLWAAELIQSLLKQDPPIALLSFFLLILWFDELFPLKKDFKIGFNLKLFLTALIVLIQQTLRFFI